MKDSTSKTHSFVIDQIIFVKAKRSIFLACEENLSEYFKHVVVLFSMFLSG